MIRPYTGRPADSFNFAHILYRKADRVATVTFNRPEVLNAVNYPLLVELAEAFRDASFDDGLGVVVLTGAGERAFCAGGDLKERDGMSDEAWRTQHELFERAAVALTECPIPVIAALNGTAYGGGLETALSCDFIYAVRGARFALSEVRLGIIPGGGGTQNLPRAVGERRAKELILTARPFTAEEGHQWGLFNRLCEPGKVLAEALETAGAIADNAPLSVRQAKKSIHYGLQMDFSTAYRFEIEAYNRLVTTEDRLEGVRAFNQKRKPVFRGR